jgi:hypothetical protein
MNSANSVEVLAHDQLNRGRSKNTGTSKRRACERGETLSSSSRKIPRRGCSSVIQIHLKLELHNTIGDEGG